MEKELFWKNFSLGTELSISGTFIYNGLKALDDIETLSYKDEIFEFLYNISVGIERLQKIVVILIEHQQITNQDDFEHRLITHSHIELLGRIKQGYQLNLGKTHNSFLQLLENFYKSMRYDRFSLKNVDKFDKEENALKEYLSKELGISFNENWFHSQNNDRIKKFLGKLIGKITEELYKIVYIEAHKQNIYTYEIRSNSKAYKIFIRKEFDFQKETILWKELLIFLMNYELNDDSVLDFINQIQPLDFDIGLIQEYLMSFQSVLKRLEHLDEIDFLFDEMPSDERKERFEILDAIGNPGIYFESDFNN